MRRYHNPTQPNPTPDDIHLFKSIIQFSSFYFLTSIYILIVSILGQSSSVCVCMCLCLCACDIIDVALYASRSCQIITGRYWEQAKYVCTRPVLGSTGTPQTSYTPVDHVPTIFRPIRRRGPYNLGRFT